MGVTSLGDWKKANPEKVGKISNGSQRSEIAKILEIGEATEIIYEQDIYEDQARVLSQEPIKSILEESIITPIFPAIEGEYLGIPMICYTNDFSRESVFHIVNILKNSPDIAFFIVERDCFNDLTPEMHCLRSLSVQKKIIIKDDVLICPYNSVVSKMANIDVKHCIEAYIYKKLFYFRPMHGDYIEIMKEKDLIESIISFVCKNYQVTPNYVYSLIYLVLYKIIDLEQNYINQQNNDKKSIITCYESINYKLYETVFPLSNYNLKNFVGLNKSTIFCSTFFYETIKEQHQNIISLNKKFIRKVQSKIAPYEPKEVSPPNDIGLIGFWKKELGIYDLEEKLEKQKSQLQESNQLESIKIKQKINELEGKIGQKNKDLMEIYYLYLFCQGKYNKIWGSMEMSVKSKDYDWIVLQEKIIDIIYEKYRNASRYRDAMFVCAFYCISDVDSCVLMSEELISDMDYLDEEDIGADAMVLFRLFNEMEFDIDIDFIVEIYELMEYHWDDKINKLLAIIESITKKFGHLKATKLIDEIELLYE